MVAVVAVVAIAVVGLVAVVSRLVCGAIDMLIGRQVGSRTEVFPVGKTTDLQGHMVRTETLH